MLVLKLCEEERAGRIPGGTAMQTGVLFSQSCAVVQWLGGLELQQEGLQCLTARDTAVCTAPAYS